MVKQRIQDYKNNKGVQPNLNVQLAAVAIDNESSV
jgi:hypothetical protein